MNIHIQLIKIRYAVRDNNWNDQRHGLMTAIVLLAVVVHIFFKFDFSFIVL